MRPFKIITAPRPRAHIVSQLADWPGGNTFPEFRGEPDFLPPARSWFLMLRFLGPGTVGTTSDFILDSEWRVSDSGDRMHNTAARFSNLQLRVGSGYNGEWLSIGFGVQIRLVVGEAFTLYQRVETTWQAFRGLPDAWAEVDLQREGSNPMALVQDGEKVGRVARDVSGSANRAIRYHPVTVRLPSPGLKGPARGNLALSDGYPGLVSFYSDISKDTALLVHFDRCIDPLIGGGPETETIFGAEAPTTDFIRFSKTRRGWFQPVFPRESPDISNSGIGPYPPRFAPGLLDYALSVTGFRLNYFIPSSPRTASELGFSGTGTLAFVPSADVPEVGARGFGNWSGDSSSRSITFTSGAVTANVASSWAFEIMLRGRAGGNGTTTITINADTGTIRTLTINDADLPREWTRYAVQGVYTSAKAPSITITHSGDAFSIDYAACNLRYQVSAAGTGRDGVGVTDHVRTDGAFVIDAVERYGYTGLMSGDYGTLGTVFQWDENQSTTTESSSAGIIFYTRLPLSNVSLYMVQTKNGIHLLDRLGNVILETTTLTSKNHGDWTSVCFTWDHMGGSPSQWRITLYVDGTSVATSTTANEVPADDTQALGLVALTVWLGHISFIAQSGMNTAYQTLIGERRAWTAAEVLGWHNSWTDAQSLNIRRATSNRFYLTRSRFRPADAGNVVADGPIELIPAGGVGRRRPNYGSERSVLSARDNDGTETDGFSL